MRQRGVGAGGALRWPVRGTQALFCNPIAQKRPRHASESGHLKISVETKREPVGKTWRRDNKGGRRASTSPSPASGRGDVWDGWLAEWLLFDKRVWEADSD